MVNWQRLLWARLEDTTPSAKSSECRMFRGRLSERLSSQVHLPVLIFSTPLLPPWFTFPRSYLQLPLASEQSWWGWGWVYSKKAEGPCDWGHTVPTWYEEVPAQMRPAWKEVWERGPCIHCATLPKSRHSPAPQFRLIVIPHSWSFNYRQGIPLPRALNLTSPITFPLAQKLLASQRTIFSAFSCRLPKIKVSVQSTAGHLSLGGGFHFIEFIIMTVAGLLRCRAVGWGNPVCVEGKMRL